MDCTSLDMTLTVTLSPRLGGVAGLGLPLYIVFSRQNCQKLLYEARLGLPAASERAAVQEEEEEEEEEEAGLVGKGTEKLLF
jgi:hypothetical protein